VITCGETTKRHRLSGNMYWSFWPV